MLVLKLKYGQKSKAATFPLVPKNWSLQMFMALRTSQKIFMLPILDINSSGCIRLNVPESVNLKCILCIYVKWDLHNLASKARRQHLAMCLEYFLFMFSWNVHQYYVGSNFRDHVFRILLYEKCQKHVHFKRKKYFCNFFLPKRRTYVQCIELLLMTKKKESLLHDSVSQG